MKVLLIVQIVVIGLFLIIQKIIAMSTAKTETQEYKVIKVEDKFEVRYYSSVTLAKVSSNIKSYRDLGYSGFTILAKYIFGGNSDKKSIAMTSPVHMEIGDSVSTVAFVMPSKFSKYDLPKPDNTDIVFETSSPEYVAAIRFGGFATTAIINKQKLLLENALKVKGLTYYGNFRYLGYNPPYQLLGRRNEVIVSLNAENFK